MDIWCRSSKKRGSQPQCGCLHNPRNASRKQTRNTSRKKPFSADPCVSPFSLSRIMPIGHPMASVWEILRRELRRICMAAWERPIEDPLPGFMPPPSTDHRYRPTWYRPTRWANRNAYRTRPGRWPLPDWGTTRNAGRHSRCSSSSSCSYPPRCWPGRQTKRVLPVVLYVVGIIKVVDHTEHRAILIGVVDGWGHTQLCAVDDPAAAPVGA